MAPEILPDLPVIVAALPVEQHNARRPDFLAGMKKQMNVLHPRGEGDGFAILGRREIDHPVAAPADRAQQALVAVLKMEKRQCALGRTPAGVGEVETLAVMQVFSERTEILDRRVAAPRVMQDGIAPFRGAPVERLNILKNRRVLVAAIGEVEHPVEGVEVGEGADLGHDLELGRGINENEPVKLTAGAGRRFLRPLPRGEKRGRILPVIFERERQRRLPAFK